jgi:hypothetical protein
VVSGGAERRTILSVGGSSVKRRPAVYNLDEADRAVLDERG